MALVSKTDLILRGKYTYSWKAVPSDNPHITGKVDSGRVSRTEGYEVVDFMNAYAASQSITGLANAFKLEDMLHENKDAMRAEVKSWLEANWWKWTQTS